MNRARPRHRPPDVKGVIQADDTLLIARPDCIDPGLMGCHATVWQRPPSWARWRRNAKLPPGTPGGLCIRPDGHAGPHRWVAINIGARLSEG